MKLEKIITDIDAIRIGLLQGKISYNLSQVCNTMDGCHPGYLIEDSFSFVYACVECGDKVYLSDVVELRDSLSNIQKRFSVNELKPVIVELNEYISSESVDSNKIN